MNIIKKSIDDIKPNDYNPNKIDDTKFKALVENIKKFGYVQPILIDNTNVIIDGEHRFRACKEAGITEIECVVYDGNTDIKEYRKILTLSMNNLRGEVEQENFEQVIKDLAYSMDYEELESLTGFDANEISDIVQADKYDNEGEDDVPEMDECLVIKEGDIIELGKHRLMCGDSTVKESVDKLMNGLQADMVFTDPPYNIDFKYNKYKDNLSINEYKCFCESWFKVIKHIKNIIITCGKNNIKLWHEISIIKDIGIWYKKNSQYSSSIAKLSYYEPIIFIGKFVRNGNNDIFDYYVNSGFLRYKEIASVGKDHPCPKPVKLLEDIFNNYSNSENIILDIFLGSGSTLIACEKTNRICYGMELDQHYCSVIIERYCKYVDNQKIKINGKDIDWNEYKTGEKQA